MEILAFVDTHGSLKAIKKIKQKAKKADLLVCAGDLTIFEQGLDYFLKTLDKLKKPVLVIPGNHESDKDLRKASYLFKNIFFLHETSYKKNSYLFLGYGSGGFSIKDKHFEKKTSKKFERIIKKALIKDKKTKIILITHAPPYKTKVDKIMGSPCGNKSIKNFIKKIRPDLVITGHLHENAGKIDKKGKTTIINPGPFGKIINI